MEIIMKKYINNIMVRTIYYDRKHGGCIRILNRINETKSIIKGVYGIDESPKGYWFAEVTHLDKDTVIDDNIYNMTVDFKFKKNVQHKENLYAYMQNYRIYWEDGNVWLQMSA